MLVHLNLNLIFSVLFSQGRAPWRPCILPLTKLNTDSLSDGVQVPPAPLPCGELLFVFWVSDRYPSGPRPR